MQKKSQLFLLELARRSLEHFFNTGNILEIFESDVPVELKEKRGTFVTLTKNDELRGCIGYLEPVQEIYKDVVDNSLSAAFADTRFDPLLEEELENIKIEISILSEPKLLVYNDAEDLLKKLRPEIDGVIIKKGKFSATYLPQVWEDVQDKDSFMSSLCIKAGLNPDEWRKNNLEIQTYEAEVFHE